MLCGRCRFLSINDRTFQLLHSQLHPPVHLEEKQRLEKVLAKLRTETQQGSVIALQEVSRGWAGQLHTFFARAGYHFVHCESVCAFVCAHADVV